MAGRQETKPWRGLLSETDPEELQRIIRDALPFVGGGLTSVAERAISRPAAAYLKALQEAEPSKLLRYAARTGRALPPQATGTVRLYRGQPRVVLEKYRNLPESRVGRFFTRMLGSAEQYAHSSGSDPVILYVDVPESELLDTSRFVSGRQGQDAAEVFVSREVANRARELR